MSRVLIAESSKGEASMYSELLAHLGYEYSIFPDGKSLIKEFMEESADLIILDYNLPDMNGIELCRAIRRESQGVVVPLIIASSKDDEDLIMEALDSGATDFLQKPFNHNHFIAKVKSYVNFYSLHQKDSVLVKNKMKFAGRYLIDKLIGCGSHSSIFLAEDSKGEYGKVAIKLLMESASEEHFASAFIDIANKFKKLDCVNIIKIYDSGQYAGRLYLVMEYAEDGDLATILKRKTLSDYDTAELISDISNGIKVLKENDIVHFDIKPENIMLNGHTFQLADFGIIPPQKKRTVSLSSNDIWTTLEYVAPEYLDPDFKNVDSNESCDIYSLGVTAYEAFTGINLFESNKAAVSISKQINLIPPPLTDYGPVSLVLSDLISRMLSKKPEERPSCEEVIDLINEVLDEIKDNPPVFGSKRREIHERAVAGGLTETSGIDTVHSRIEGAGKKFVDPLSGVTDNLFSGSSSQHAGLKFDIYSKMRQSALVIFFIVIIFVLALSGYAVFTYFTKETYNEKRGAVRETICSACGHIEQRVVVDIDKEICSKCKKKALCYVMFCRSCGHTFPFKKDRLPKTKMDKEQMLKKLAALNRCPKCQSSDTQPALTDADLIRELNEFKSRQKRLKSGK